MKVFDRELLQLRANKLTDSQLSPNFLKEEICQRTAEKLSELKNNFACGLELGSGVGEFYNCLYNKEEEFYNPQKITELWQSDFISNFLNHNPYPNKILLDEENISLKSNSFDIVVSNFSLHNINNPESVFKNIYRILKEDGAFLMSIPTLGTLYPLSEILFEVEMKLFNGVSPRIHPFVDITTLGNLVQEAGFKEITVDKDKIEIMYSSIPKIFADLRNSAQTNILTTRNKNYVGKKFFKEVEDSFQKHKDSQSNCYPIVIEFANLIAWK
ncbi:MAG: methyltransferase domain-containing protein [Alphaproteobacteria bacterium]|jgi:ubiquinone/menaquinone biosynthesis C-methylase UbiE|nr:methyltransferase domain-containing protein [Alphaproteobacteria bacterium]